MLTDTPPRKTSSARFLQSDRMRTLDLPQDRTLLAIAKSIESGMKAGSSADVRRSCAEFLRFPDSWHTRGFYVHLESIPKDCREWRVNAANATALGDTIRVR